MIRNNGIYNLLKESIYHIEAQCDNISSDIVNKEAKRLKKKLQKYNYPTDSVNQAIIEFYQYFSVDIPDNV